MIDFKFKRNNSKQKYVLPQFLTRKIRMSLIANYKNLSLSKKIYLATTIGFLLGMFFGDRCAILEPVNILFIKLFQITILPYMVFSIIQSIGSMTTDNAKIIGKKGGIVLIVEVFQNFV